MVETREFFDSFPAMQHKDNQGLAPPRATDPGWAHGIMVNGGRQKIKCKYCHKVMLGGGISRLKQHLAGERGNVAPCEEVPEEVKMQIQQHLGFKVLNKLKRQRGPKSSKNSVVSYFQDRDEIDEEDVPQTQKTALTRGTIRRKGKEVLGASNRIKKHKRQFFPAATPVASQPIHENSASQENVDQADMAVARFMYEAAVPFTAANSYYFQQLADAIAAVGPGYKMPSYHSLRGRLLNRSFQDVGVYCEELRKSWEVTGCSVMVDRLTDGTDCTIINFFVYCPKGTMFLKSVDASGIEGSPEAILNLFDSAVQEVGPKNIVNFVTDTSPSYRAAAKLLADKYKTFFCSVCGAHCIDLMLMEIGKMDEVQEILAKAKRITQFIYNNAWALNLMRKKTGGKDIIQLASTKFTSIFLTLQSILSLKDPLHRMFTCSSWMQSTFSKERGGREVAEIIVDPPFWSQCDQILKVTRPLLTVLHLLEAEERPSAGYLYDAIEKAKKSISIAFNNKESDYLPYLEVINHIWQEQLHSPLHAAAYYLNPSMFYDPSFCTNKVVHKSFLDCIETLEPSLSAQVMITSHITFYEEAAGDFGRPVALRGRDSLAPATWWSLYAADYPDLQRLAVRILSQTCSITKCERTWNMFKLTHSKRRNRLENSRMNDFIFTHYNLRLKERRSEASSVRCTRETLDPICSEAMNFNMGEWVEDPRVMEGEDLSWMDVAIPSQRINLSHKVEMFDDCNDSTDDKASDDSKGIDGHADI